MRIAAFINQMSRILHQAGVFQQLFNPITGKEVLEQIIGSQTALFQRIQVQDKAGGKRFHLGVNKSAASNPLRASDEFHGATLIARKAEALVDSFFIKAEQRFDAQAHVGRIRHHLKPCFARQQGQNSVAHNRHRSFDTPLLPADLYSNDGIVFYDEILNKAIGEKVGSCLPGQSICFAMARFSARRPLPHLLSS